MGNTCIPLKQLVHLFGKDCVIVFGNNCSIICVLPPSKFQKLFQLTDFDTIGQLPKIQLWHDHSGKKSPWIRMRYSWKELKSWKNFHILTLQQLNMAGDFCPSYSSMLFANQSFSSHLFDFHRIKSLVNRHLQWLNPN